MRCRYLLATLMLLASPVMARTPEPAFQGLTQEPPEDPVTIESFRSLSSVPVGGTIELAVRLRIAPHWHVNAHRTADEYLIPTRAEFALPPGWRLSGMAYPDPIEKTLGFSDHPLLLYEDLATIGARIEVPPDADLGPASVTARVTYQACDNSTCLAPVDREVEIALELTPPTEAIDAKDAEIFAGLVYTATEPPSAAGDVASESRLGSIIAERGYLFAFLVVFLWGLALNLTPCVYPIIPITVGYFGGQSGGRASRTFVLACLYVLGMATMYSALGLFAALTGSLLGTALQNPLVVIFVALVLVTLALSMFGFYEIRLPMQLTSLAGKSTARGGFVGAFLTGLTVGIVAAPCIGPFVLALLTYVGESQSPLLGFSLFFTLAVGLGLPFIFLALASGSISRLPRSGEWMEWVKKLFGLVLIAMAVFFLEPLLPRRLYFVLQGLVLAAGGIWLGFVLRVASSSRSFQAFKRVVGVALPLLGIYLIAAPGHVFGGRTEAGGIAWTPYTPELRSSAIGRPVIIDFAADWCIPCKELDLRTFSAPAVVAAVEGMATLKADLTHTGTPEVTRLREQYAIRGVPTVVFIDAAGEEREDLRVLGFVDADDFLARVERLKNNE